MVDNSNNFANSQAKSFPIKKIHFDTIDSTNTWAKLHADQWLENGLTVVSAGTQTAGRGRFKRQWHSPPNVNLYVTFCFWLQNRLSEIGYIPQLLALSTRQVLELQGFQTAIKWPNDILLNKKKVAGILCETISEDHGRGVVCGIGLNINMSLIDANRIDRPATSLLIESGQEHSLDTFQHALEQQFNVDLSKWMQEGFTPFFQKLVKYSAYKKGDKVRFHDNLQWLEGTFEQMNADGSVQLQLKNGVIRNFYAGEFEF